VPVNFHESMNLAKPPEPPWLLKALEKWEVEIIAILFFLTGGGSWAAFRKSKER
jgi:hypothetical protein